MTQGRGGLEEAKHTTDKIRKRDAMIEGERMAREKDEGSKSKWE